MKDCLGNTQIRRHHEPAPHGAAGGGAVCTLRRNLFGLWELTGWCLCYRHKAMIAYMTHANLPQTCAALREELGDSISVEDATLKKYEGLLEKKWTSVVRLQKKVGAVSCGVPHTCKG